MSRPTTSEYIRGSLYGIAAVSMWTAWILAVRFGIRTSLTPLDITAIRFGVAGLVFEAVHLGCIRGGTCWVAVDEHDKPVGFLSAEAVAERELHIHE